MRENLAEQVIRPSCEQIVGSIRHSGVQEILRRAQEVEDEITEQRSIVTAQVQSGVSGQPAPTQTDHKLVGAAGCGKGYRAGELHQG